MDYQRKNLADMSNIGNSGPLPAALFGLRDKDLADLSWVDRALGYYGHGFFPVARSISALAFKQRLTGAERIAIRAAAVTDAVITDFLDLLDTPGQGMIDLDHPDTVAGVAYLVSHNLLTVPRAAAIRA